jgi:hypothetical protein
MTAFTWFAARLRLTLASAAPKLCMRRHAIACLATFFTFYPACSQAPAQTSPGAWPNGSVDINSGWRAQDGDNLAWAQPRFDRTRAISTQSAQQIAHAAQQFGQEDDITVLTLTFTGAEVPHA